MCIQEKRNLQVSLLKNKPIFVVRFKSIRPTHIIGKYDRMIFTSGVDLRNVGKLKNVFILNSTILEQSNDITAVLSDNYKLGFFVALTYNLTKNVRNKISKYK